MRRSNSMLKFNYPASTKENQVLHIYKSRGFLELNHVQNLFKIPSSLMYKRDIN